MSVLDRVLTHPDDDAPDVATAAMPAAVARFVDDLGDIPIVTEAKVVRRRSRDFFWFSPILNEELGQKFADVIVRPRSEADVLRIAGAAVRHGVPLTARGGGTGNYGQSVPLEGGALVEMADLADVASPAPGICVAGAGARLVDMDAALRPGGWELRMHPSTKRSAMIGGFVAGGSGGVGSVTWGGLREPGNVHAARIVTAEATPRVLDLEGPQALAVNRAYGTTGLITRLTVPLAPAWEWIDVVAVFETFDAALECAEAVALADGITKKVLTPIAWPIPATFTALADACPEGRHILIAMIAAPSMAPFRDIVGAHRGEISHEAPSDDGAASTPIYEYTWNHTTLQWLKTDRSVTYLQALYPHDRLLETVREMAARFADELVTHLEFIRFAGRMTASGIPIIRYTTRERLGEIIAAHEAAGITIANPHVVTLEDGSRHKRAVSDQLGFKRQVDPRGLLNPGKMRTFTPDPA